MFLPRFWRRRPHPLTELGGPVANIAVVTLATPNIACYAKLSFANKLAYAQRHGYDFYHYTSVLDRTRPPSWSKVRIIQKHLSAYDWVFWTDADSLIMNPSIALQDILLRAGSCNMVLTPGPRDKYNTGQWMVRRCEWSATVLQQIWEEVRPSDFWYRGNPWEQRALAQLVERNSEIAKDICVLAMREMNSRPESAYIDRCPELTGLDYEPGDFIVHFYHTKDAALRLKGMARYYEEWLCSQAEHQLATDEVDSFSGGYKWVARKPSDDFR